MLKINSYALFLLTGVLAAALSCQGKKTKKTRNGNSTVSSENTQTEDIKSTNSDQDIPANLKADYGLKSGRQLYNTYKAVLGYDGTTNNVAQQVDQLFATLEGALPLGNRMQQFDAAKQSAILKLAAGVCDDFSKNRTLMTAFFGTNLPATNQQLSEAQMAGIAKTLLQRFWGPAANNAAGEEKVIATLIADLQKDGINNADVVKAACTAIAASLPSSLF